MDEPHVIISVIVGCLVLILALLMYRRRATFGGSSGSGTAKRAEIDWPKFESQLAVALETEIDKFATDHPKETFYGVALDCNAAYCDILLCANTPDSLNRAASNYLRENPGSTLEEELGQLRWGLGDWEYHAFAIVRPEALGARDELDDPLDTEQFLVSACRALRKLEGSPALSRLGKTSEFRLACMDHDEDLAAGDKRASRARV